MAKLVVRDGDGVAHEYPLKPSVSAVGRSPGLDVYLNFDSVSRRHAEIRCINDEYFLIDLGSLNGVYLNDRRVSKGVLREGDEVRFGKVRTNFSLGPCERQLEKMGGGVFARFFGGLQESSTAFEGQFGNLFDFLSTGSQKAQKLESSLVDTLRKRTDRFEQAYRQLTILYRVSQWINTEIDVRKVLDACLDLAVTTLKADRGVILLFQAERDELELSLAKSRDSTETTLRSPEWIKGIARRVFDTRQPMVLSPEYATPNTAALTHSPNTPSFIALPLMCREDDPKGVIYFDTREKNRSFLSTDVDFLATFGAQVAMGYERDSLIEQVVVKKEMEKEMGIAQDIQRRLLPRAMPQSPRFRVAGRSIPSKLVGGDYFDAFTTGGEGTLSVIVADVSGKGIPAALVLSETRSLIKVYGAEHAPPSVVLHHLNERLLEDFDGSMYVTIVYGLLDLARGVLRYANAGHEWPMVLSPGAPAVTYLDRSSKPCGLFEDEGFEEVEVALRPGDRLVFPTDGVIDAEEPGGAKFGIERLQQVVLQTRGLEAQGCLDAIFGQVLEFSKGGPQFDDMTLLIVDTTGNDPAPGTPPKG